jgi:hypothetical protein
VEDERRARGRREADGVPIAETAPGTRVARRRRRRMHDGVGGVKMSCNRTFKPKGSYLSTYAVSATYFWATEWTPVVGMSLADVNLLLRNVDGNYTAKPVYQTAAVRPDNPDAPVAFVSGAYVNTAGYTQFHESLSITDKLLIRFGVGYKNSSGTALGGAWTEPTVAVRQCGRVVGRGAAIINPGMISGTDLNYFPIGQFQPCVGLDKVMGAFVVMDNESTYLEYQLVIRTAKDPQAPNAWQTCEAGYSNPAAGNSERNTTLLSDPSATVGGRSLISV